MRHAICTAIATVIPAFLLASGKTPAPRESVRAASASAASMTAIRIIGPATIAPGATGQFTAIAEHSDGSVEDVTARARWNVLSGPLVRETNVLRFVGAGTAQGGTRGEADVHAFLGTTRSNRLTVFVLEPGTFRVSGTVTESGQGVDFATIEIVAGTGAGLRTTTSADRSGQFWLYGAAGDVELRASANGLEPQVRRIVVTDHASEDFVLTPLVSAPADLSGSWILTLSAPAKCRARWPAIARERVFDAEITQRGTHFHVMLTSPTIANGHDELPGRIFGQALSFSTGYDDSDVLDRLSSTQWLSMYGVAQGTATGAAIHATLDGLLQVYESGPSGPIGAATAVCQARDHMMVLRRREALPRSSQPTLVK